MTEGAQLAETELGALAIEAFFYGFPLVFDLSQVRRFEREGIGAVPATPYNQFGHANRLAGPETTFVSVNNDTVCSIANVDVSGGPVCLEVPDTQGRYYALQFVDAWTNNFAYVGHRATGTEAGSFLLVERDWGGEPPSGVRVIRFPTNIATLVGRWAVDGEADLPNVAELQERLTLTPPAPGDGVPDGDPRVPEDLHFFEQLRVWMAHSRHQHATRPTSGASPRSACSIRNRPTPTPPARRRTCCGKRTQPPGRKWKRR